MKQTQLRLTLPLILAVALMSGPIGCQTTGDPILVNAQKATETAFNTFDLFVHLEKANRPLADSIDPAIHKAAEDIRKHGLDWIDSANNAMHAYQTNRDDTSKSTLQKALADLSAGLAEARKYTDVLTYHGATQPPMTAKTKRSLSH